MSHLSPATRSRRFTLLDALVLVAASAAGFALSRALYDLGWAVYDIEVTIAPHSGQPDSRIARWSEYSWGASPALAMGHPSSWTERAALWPAPCVAAWTLALLALAIHPPRSPLTRLIQRPGVVAGLAFVAAIFATVVACPSLVMELSGPWQVSSLDRRHWFVYSCLSLPRHAGFAVGLAWLVLLMSGRWASHHEWLDSAGRCAGWFWIVTGSMSLISAWLRAFSL